MNKSSLILTCWVIVGLLAGCGADVPNELNGSCGDGVVDAVEACDDGNRDDGDGCTSLCTLPSCGDGAVQAGETCDDGNTVDTDSCTNACRAAACGDGILRTDIAEGMPGYEACDDGNQSNDDGCSSVCSEGRCGDGIQSRGEGCDDGNDDNSDGCVEECRPARCGDGHLQRGVEECDDGNLDRTDSCTNDCVPARCGDGVHRQDRRPGDEGFEGCDDGNDIQTDGCLIECELAACGDGYRRTDLAAGERGYEACDDGNSADTDACLSSCESARCGDGIVRLDLTDRDAEYEACDDANDDDFDACVGCEYARCGDGFRRTDLAEGADGYEVCDDGNEENTDLCLNDCTVARCGDGHLMDGVEECDDGNAVDSDACRNVCQSARCGDGVVRGDLAPGEEGAEACDLGEANGGDICSDNCQPRITQLAVGTYHACARRHDGSAYCWGGGTQGQLGNGASDDSTVPVPVRLPVIDGQVVGFASVTVGAYHSCGLTQAPAAGHVYCWGSNTNNARDGRPGGVEFANTPRPVGGLGSVSTLASSSYHSCVQNDRSEIICWGANDAGQLGNGTRQPADTPQSVSAHHRSPVAVFYGGACAVEPRAPSIECWGRTADTVTGSDRYVTSPRTAALLTVHDSVDKIVGGYSHACALIRNGGRRSVRCWGANHYWQAAGAATDPPGISATTVPDLTHPIDLVGGTFHTCALEQGGTVKCWGSAQYGALGAGDDVDLPRNSPRSVRLVEGLESIRQISARSGTTTCALTADHSVRCWGRSTRGILGVEPANVSRGLPADPVQFP